MTLTRRTLHDLTIDDEDAFSGIALHGRLKRSLLESRYPFLVAGPAPRESNWDRVLLLNLTFWDPADPADVLAEPRLSADVVAHVAWHQLVQKALHAPTGLEGTPPSRGFEGHILAEAVASAFDLYLVGRLLARGIDCDFLDTQVPAMTEAAGSAGLSEAETAALFESVAADPDRAFEDLRQLLLDTTLALHRCKTPLEASRALEVADGHRFGALLHHYELSTWLLQARAHDAAAGAAAPGTAGGAGPDLRALAIDRALRAAPVSLDLLERLCLDGAP